MTWANDRSNEVIGRVRVTRAGTDDPFEIDIVHETKMFWTGVSSRQPMAGNQRFTKSDYEVLAKEVSAL